MNNNDIVLKTIEYVKKASIYNDFGHDYLHVERVLALANKIASTCPECDTFIVKMVALLHDVEDDKLESKNHFSVKGFLKEMKLSDITINKIIFTSIFCVLFYLIFLLVLSRKNFLK